MEQTKLLQELLKILDNKQKISITSAYETFINYSKLRCRIDTINYYEKKWKVLKEVLEELDLIFLDQINKLTYNQIITILKLRNYKNITINKFTDLLKQIFKVNVDLEIISSSPIANIKKLKTNIPEIETISDNTNDLILSYLENLPKTFLNVRNLLIIRLLIDTGARINEIVNIEHKNVKIDSRAVYLSFTKTNKPRYVYISQKTIETLKSYLKWHNGNKYLLLNTNGTQIKKDSIYNLIEQLKKKLNITGINPHRFRHTFATKLIEENVNLSLVMDVLGHTQFETTKRYIHVNVEHKATTILKALKKE